MIKEIINDSLATRLDGDELSRSVLGKRGTQSVVVGFIVRDDGEKMMDTIYRYYTLSYSEKDGNYSSRRTGSLGVIAKDIIQAVHIGQQLKPISTIWNVTHHGIIHGIAPDAQTLVIDEY